MQDLKKTARATGLWYLGLAVAGVVAMFWARPALYVSGDSAATAANLVEHESLARIGIAGNLMIVLTQALVSLWFYRLYRGINPLAAGALAAFGLINSAAILVATAFSATALSSALAGDATSAQLLYDLDGAIWNVAGLFFGLWLIPMGYIVASARVAPRVLGWILMAGGVGYITTAFVTFIWADAPSGVGLALTSLASVGEFWMIGYLLTIGIRKPQETPSLRG